MIIEVLELLDSQGQKTGKWRLTVRSGEKTNPRGLCTHVHDFYLDAWNCIEAWEAAKKISGDSYHTPCRWNKSTHTLVLLRGSCYA